MDQVTGVGESWLCCSLESGDCMLQNSRQNKVGLCGLEIISLLESRQGGYIFMRSE